jgi:uncharacterized protein
MLVILPPSETKVSGGDEKHPLNISTLSFGSQNSLRESLVDQTIELSSDSARARKALKLGPKGDAEIARNRLVRESAGMPALFRYTGVLYDALELESMEEDERSHAQSTLSIFSALWGLIRATDVIPAYRLSWDSMLPGGRVRNQWRPAGEPLWQEVEGFVLDVRSEGYRSLAPVPSNRGVYVALVTPGEPGSRPALGHANKAVKGKFVRELLASGETLESVADFADWGSKYGYEVDSSSHQDGRIEVVISGS